MLGLSQFFPSSEGPTPSRSLSVISESMTFQGTTISGPGDLRIEGSVRADISVEGRIYVAPGAEVYGEVHAQSILVAGYVEGSLDAAEKLVLTDQAVVSATLEMRTLRIDSGAQFEGQVQPHERDSSESSFSLEPERSSSPASSGLVSSSGSSTNPEEKEHVPESPPTSSSSVEGESTSSEESTSQDDEAESDTSVSSSVEESGSSSAPRSENLEEEDSESSYGFQW